MQEDDCNWGGTGGGGGGGGGKSLCIATCDAEMTQCYGKQIGSPKKNFSFHLHIASV